MNNKHKLVVIITKLQSSGRDIDIITGSIDEICEQMVGRSLTIGTLVAKSLLHITIPKPPVSSYHEDFDGTSLICVSAYRDVKKTFSNKLTWTNYDTI